MCGRFVSVSTPQALVEAFGVEESAVEEHEPDYNVTPRAMVPIVRDRAGSPRHPGPTTRVLSLVRWGLVPSWADDPSIGDRLINARADSVVDKPAFKRAFARRRCIVPADAFYEWTEAPRVRGRRSTRQPFVVRRRDAAPLAFAGLWEIWRDDAIEDPDAPGAWLRSCTIVTTGANEVVAPIHDRMPVVLAERDWDTWLDPENHDVGTLIDLLVPPPAEWFEVHPVSMRVNSPDNNDPELLDPVDAQTETLFRA